jgi:hypothetical protein
MKPVDEKDMKFYARKEALQGIKDRSKDSAFRKRLEKLVDKGSMSKEAFYKALSGKKDK